MQQRILEAATRLFAARGYDATPIQAVADAVGVSKQAVLHHFPSKEELHRSVLDALLTHWKDVVPQLLLAATSRHGGAEAAVRGLTRELVRFFVEDADRARLLLREALDRPEAMRERLRVHVRPWVEAIGAHVRQQMPEGAARGVDAEVQVMNVILLLVSGIASLDCVAAMVPGPSSTFAERFVAEATRMALASIGLGAEVAEPRARARRTRPSRAKR